MVDAKFSSHLAGNVGHPLAALCYAISLLYCTPVGLDSGGAGLGAMWGTELAGQMLATAGFGQVEILDSPGPRTASSSAAPDSRKPQAGSADRKTGRNQLRGPARGGHLRGWMTLRCAPHSMSRSAAGPAPTRLARAPRRTA